MEAIALHDFKAITADEISFKAGTILKLLSTEEGNSWFKVELNGREGYLHRVYVQWNPPLWYINGITKPETLAKLLERDASNRFIQPDGAFLIRPSEATPYGFSMSLKYGSDVQHFKIMQDNCGKYHIWNVKFDSVNALVDFHRSNSVSRTQNILLRDMVFERVIASYDYKPQYHDDMELHRGDIITVLIKKEPNWWTGEVTRDNITFRGLIPRTYVTEYSGGV